MQGFIALLDLSSQLFFGLLAGVEKLKGPLFLLGPSVSFVLHPLGEPSGKLAKVFDEHPAGVKISLHDGGLIEMAQSAAQPEPVQAAQGALDKRGVFVKKATRNAAQFGTLWGFHQPRFYHTGGVSSFGCGSAALSPCVFAPLGLLTGRTGGKSFVFN